MPLRSIATVFYHRLEQGYERIERGLMEGNDVTTWEDFWVSLLREYERVCDDLQRDLAALASHRRSPGKTFAASRPVGRGRRASRTGASPDPHHATHTGWRYHRPTNYRGYSTNKEK
jgi:hypothetical protein